MVETTKAGGEYSVIELEYEPNVPFTLVRKRANVSQ